jgi:hypothetical protein
MGLKAAVDRLVSRGASESEGVLQLEFEFGAWLSGETINLSSNFDPLLSNASWHEADTGSPSKRYGQLIFKLTDRFGVSRREAAIILTQLPTIIMLAGGKQMSSAGIARLLARMGEAATVDWRMVEVIMAHFGIHNELDESKVTTLLQSEKSQAEADLGDSKVETIVEVISEHAEEIGLDPRFARGVARLFRAETRDCFVPYLQTLLYLAVIDQFFDHPTEYLYTFKPRGGAANAIFGFFPSALAPTGNPILNNFKAVDRLTADWARSRHDQREMAVALVDVVEGLSSLAFLPRQRLSTLLRLSLLKFIQINTPAIIRLAKVRSLDQVEHFIRRVSATPTGTRGIIEQRLSDFFGVIQHPAPDWRSRGLGDPVNATNRSSKKLGDSDFQDTVARRCVAMEAHAGRLTDV